MIIYAFMIFRFAPRHHWWFAPIFFIVLFIVLVPHTRAISFSVDVLESPVSITLAPLIASINNGDTQQFIAVANFVNDPPLDITNNPLTVWTSTDTAIASMNGTGLATGLEPGTSLISITYGGATAHANLEVINPPAENNNQTPDNNAGNNGGNGNSQNEPNNTPPNNPPDNLPDNNPPDNTPPNNQPPNITPPANPPSQTPGELPGPPPPNQPSFNVNPEGELPKGTPLLTKTYTDAAPENTIPYLDPLTEKGIVYLPDALGVTRGEILFRMNQEFSLETIHHDFLQNCSKNIQDCLSIFLNVTKFHNTILADTIEKLQLYPDVPTNYHYAFFINMGTLLNIVQGYYDQAESPFRPDQIITRIEAIKVLLGSVNAMKWLYYPELEALLGGKEGVFSQITPFQDVDPQQGQWWYPRYAQKACDIGMVDCSGTSTLLRPNDFITEQELQDMLSRLKQYLQNSGSIDDVNKDNDNDGLSNYYERNITLTQDNNPDTDNDGLTDGEEVNIYKTSPFSSDSDQDNLSDAVEVKQLHTDPLQPDTDHDGFNDALEVQAHTDPLDPHSFPYDTNKNTIADTWEQQYHITVKDGQQDSDFDGLSDTLEYQYGTNPLLSDSDGDGVSDALEVLQYHSNPLDAQSPGTINEFSIMITNFTEHQLVSDTTPLVKGIAFHGATVEIILRNDYGQEKILGSTTTDDNNTFIFEATEPLRDGKYALMARSLQPQKKLLVDSAPVHIEINSTLQVIPPEPKKLGDKEISEDILVKNLRIIVKNNRPVLVGSTEFGSRVTVTWRSIVTTSALIADSLSGDFEAMAPNELADGEHTVYVVATRSKDNAQSETVKVSFKVDASIFGADQEGKGKTIENYANYLLVPQNTPWAIAGAGFLMLAVIGVWLWRKKKTNNI